MLAKVKLLSKGLHRGFSVVLKPVIAVGLGSVDNGFMGQFNGADTVSIRQLMNKRLKDNNRPITDLSPREITKLAEEVFIETKANALICSGSTNTIAKFFQSEAADFPKKLDTPTANSIFKMGIAYYALLKGIPTIYSCDATNYPIVALGGKISPVQHDIVHNTPFTTHNLIIKRGTWLAREAAKTTSLRDKDGNVIIKDVSSTHPLYPTKLPDNTDILASAPDGSTSIFSIAPLTMGIVDHPESGPVCEFRRGESTYPDEKEENLEGLKLWSKISNIFIIAASLPKNTYPISENRLSPRILEILNAPNVSELSETKLSMATGKSR